MATESVHDFLQNVFTCLSLCTLYMNLLSMLYEKMVNTLGPSGLTVERVVPLHSLSFGCFIIEVLLRKEDLNYGGREVWEAQ